MSAKTAIKRGRLRHETPDHRFPRRRAEITLGLLNIADQNYKLNPLNIYNELPRERTLAVRFSVHF